MGYTDDSDVCGYETADGSPCQNLATEGDHCWLKGHGGDVEAGRDFTLDESDHEDILEAARMGASKAGCARAAGVVPNVLNRYLEADEHSEFRQAFTRARAEGEQRLIKGPLWDDQNAERQMDGQHARFLLSTSFDYEKTEKREISGGDGGPLEVTLNREVVGSDDE